MVKYGVLWKSNLCFLQAAAAAAAALVTKQGYLVKEGTLSMCAQ